MQLKTGIEWQGPFSSVQRVTSADRSVHIPLARLEPRAQAITLALQSDEVQRIELRLGSAALSITQEALQQRRGWGHDDAEWIELPFFARHPLYGGEVARYSEIELRVEFATPGERSLAIMQRCAYLDCPLATALSEAHRYASVAVAQHYSGVLRAKAIPLPVDKPIDEARLDYTALAYTLRDFWTTTLPYAPRVDIVLPQRLFPVRLYITARSAEKDHCALEVADLQLDGRSASAEFQLLPHSYAATLTPAVAKTITLHSASAASTLCITIEHDQRVIACNGLIGILGQ